MKNAAPFLLLVILFGAAGWYFFTEEPETVHELPPPQLPLAPPIVERQPPPQPAVDETVADTEPEPVILPDPLPQLAESDPEVSQALAESIGKEPLTEYLVRGQVISRVVASIDSLTSRQVPPQINPLRSARGAFKVATVGDRTVLSPDNYARYDGYVALLDNMDTEALAAVYQRYDPLFQQAWEENGGEDSFNRRLTEVIDHLLETPDVPGPVYLVKPEAFYLFEDPELEAMTAGQKILVRMGSANAAVVKAKLIELREHISNE